AARLVDQLAEGGALVLQPAREGALAQAELERHLPRGRDAPRQVPVDEPPRPLAQAVVRLPAGELLLGVTLEDGEQIGIGRADRQRQLVRAQQHLGRLAPEARPAAEQRLELGARALARVGVAQLARAEAGADPAPGGGDDEADAELARVPAAAHRRAAAVDAEMREAA